MSGDVKVEPVFEQCDGGEEGVAEGHEQVDVIEVLPAVEAVGEVVAGIDGGSHFAAAWAEEAEIPFAHFAGWPVATE